MTKSEFLQKLAEALSQLPGDERVRVLEYYEEMIDDHIESGMSEADAVEAMGSIKEILKETTPEAFETFRSQFEDGNSQGASKCIILRAPVEYLDVFNSYVDLKVVHTALPDGMTARVDFCLSDNEQCLCTLTDGRLNVSYHKKKSQNRFSFFSLFSSAAASITVTLNSPTLRSGKINASSGDIKVEHLIFTDTLESTAASGDILMLGVKTYNNLRLHTSSGDIEGKEIICGGCLDIGAASGDVELSDTKAGRINLATASGDIEVRNAVCDGLSSNTASGDLDLNTIQAGDLSLNTSSGDIEFHEVQCSESMSCSSTSGDIRGHMGHAGLYQFRASSRTGDISIPDSDGGCLVELRSISGDINIH